MSISGFFLIITLSNGSRSKFDSLFKYESIVLLFSFSGLSVKTLKLPVFFPLLNFPTDLVCMTEI